MRVEAAMLAIAKSTPTREALVDDAATLSYEQLWEQATRVAGGLIAAGLPPGGAVAVIGRMSAQVVTTYLAVAVAGGHYVPIAPETPGPRIDAMMAAAGVVVTVRCDDDVDLGAREAMDLAELTAADPIAPRSDVGADDTLYVMFTSGSTGQSKPVAVSHRAVAASFHDVRTPMSVLPQDRFLARSYVDFDAATYEVWGALMVGAQLHFATRQHIDLHDIAELITRRCITAAFLPTALFALMTRDHASALASMRLLVVGGDVLPVTQVRQLLAIAPDIELVNCYGPTEGTVVSTSFRVRGWDAGSTAASVPIGRPYAHTTAYILDDGLRPVADGEVGDLWTGGPRLADGYVGDPGGTAERFLPDPFASRPGSRMYRTGDRARRLIGGDLEFHGRLDHEVKVSGFRVNLAEVDAVLRMDPRVQDCVSVTAGEGVHRSVVSFVVSPGVEPADIRAAASAVAPRHLVPHRVILVDGLPMAGSKVARRELERHAGEVMARELEQPSQSSPEASTALAVLRAEWELFTGAAPDPDDDFFMSGGTSLDLMRLISAIRTRAGVDVDFAELYSAESYEEVVGFVRRSAAAQEGNR